MPEYYPPRPLRQIVKPSFICYAWDQLPYDESLVEALREHPLPFQEGKPLLDVLNESAKKNRESAVTGWKPGTLDVLALAQQNLEVLDSLKLGNAIKKTAQAFSHMPDRAQAREFTRSFVPMLFNWAQKTTRSDVSDLDFIKDEGLFKFVRGINDLRDDNALGIQHALHQAVSPDVYEAFDRALPATDVRSLTRHLVQIGDKLLNASALDTSLNREEIFARHQCAERHFKASAGRMQEDLARERGRMRNQPPSEVEGARIEFKTWGSQTISLHAPRETHEAGTSHANVTNALPRPQEGMRETHADVNMRSQDDENPPPYASLFPQAAEVDASHVSTNRRSMAAPSPADVDASNLSTNRRSMERASEAHDDPRGVLRTRTVARSHMGYLPGKLGASYTTAFSVFDGGECAEAPTSERSFTEFVTEAGAPKNIRVCAKSAHDIEEEGVRAFTLTDAQGVKLDCRARGALGAVLDSCSGRSPLWQFSRDENKRWQARSASSRWSRTSTTVKYDAETKSAVREPSKRQESPDQGR